MNIDKQIKISKGYQIAKRINQFYLIKYTFKHNYYELKDHIEKQIEPELAFKLAHANYRDELKSRQLETIRLLHNFIASALSLIDNTRVFQKRLFEDKDPFGSEYQIMVDKTFLNNPLASFIKDFRQYIQHYQAPMIATVAKIADRPEDLNAQVVIHQGTLLEYSKWSGSAKKYIMSLDENLNVLYVVNQYFDLIIDFHTWFEKRQSEIFAVELAELDRLKREAARQEITTIVNIFIHSDDLSPSTFVHHMIRFFDDSQKKFYNSSAMQQKVNFIVWILKENGVLTNKKDTNILQDKLKFS